MPVTTLIDVNFFYFREKKIEVEERIVVPLGNRIVWRLFPFLEASVPIFGPLEVKLYFENLSPFRWKDQTVRFRNNMRLDEPIEIAADIADEEGEFKYGIEVKDLRANGFRYDEDPYLIIRRL
jgi:hypothetical protein